VQGATGKPPARARRRGIPQDDKALSLLRSDPEGVQRAIGKPSARARRRGIPQDDKALSLLRSDPEGVQGAIGKPPARARRRGIPLLIENRYACEISPLPQTDYDNILVYPTPLML